MGIVGRGIIIDVKLWGRVSEGKENFRVLLEQLLINTFGKNFMRPGKLLGRFYATGYRVRRGFPHISVTPRDLAVV